MAAAAASGGSSPFFLPLCLLLLLASAARALENGLGLQPAMGWNSWNHFHCTCTHTRHMPPPPYCTYQPKAAHRALRSYTAQATSTRR